MPVCDLKARGSITGRERHIYFPPEMYLFSWSIIGKLSSTIISSSFPFQSLQLFIENYHLDIWQFNFTKNASDRLFRGLCEREREKRERISATITMLNHFFKWHYYKSFYWLAVLIEWRKLFESLIWAKYLSVCRWNLSVLLLLVRSCPC